MSDLLIGFLVGVLVTATTPTVFALGIKSWQLLLAASARFISK